MSAYKVPGTHDAVLWGRCGLLWQAAPRASKFRPSSFRVAGRESAAVVGTLDRHRIGTRYGHFYSRHLLTDLGLDPDDGVVRVSMVHYNTVAEVDRLIGVLDEII